MMRWTSGVGVILAAAAFAGCGDDGPAESMSSGNLSGSTFESSDGNLVADNASGQDWANAPGLVTKNDLLSGTTDNSFGQGSKEDGPAVSVVKGSIPPNKSDLKRFYVAHENANGNFFLYLAWERSNVLGSANMDFEFNQASQSLSDSSLGSVTINRTAGDILVTYDFSGSGSPSLGLLRWVTAATGNASDCFSSNSLPCWGKRIDLSSAGYADGAVNTSTVTDPVETPSISIGGNMFGEAGINLTAAGVFPAGQCVNFASAFLKSRSSSSFTAEVKDFIAPATANISNCGSINIHKTDGANALAGAVFTLTNGTPSGTTCSGTPIASCMTAADGTCSLGSNVPYGTYCVAETKTPLNYATAPAQSVTISQAETSKTLEFVDNPLHGALLITKYGPHQSLLAGATFTVTDASNHVVATVTTTSNGTACAANLKLGASYVVTETVAPQNYSVADQPKSVAITAADSSTDCSIAPATVTFSDDPLSDISCTFTSDAGSGITAATILCTGEGLNAVPFLTHSMTGLTPGTYTCTFVITAN